MNLAIHCDGCKGGAGVWGPCYVTSLGMNIKCEKWSPENENIRLLIFVPILLIILVPDLQHPLRRAGEEDVGQEGVPCDVVDGCVVR